MKKAEVVGKLKQLYPTANVVINGDNINPTEIVAEIDPKNGEAMAIIDKSDAHHHKHTIEVYIVEKGSLDLYIDGKKHQLKSGSKLTVKPGQVHYAIGDETWVKTISTPPWSIEDHILETDKTCN
jgi:mannose-6-phosphate isomerase-like protein (cupin superfamily)